jgi:CRP/FNR family transcriptional regulator, cyclic AMP receptor protein
METLDYTTRYYASGTEIFHEGQAGKQAFLVEEGMVELDRVVGLKRTPFARIGPGGIFGEMAVIDSGPRTATATAIENTTVVVISERVFKYKLKTADPFLRALVRLFVANLRGSTPGGVLPRSPSER